MSVSNVLLSVSLMKAECVGEHFHHAWVHAVNPPEQHTYTSTCTDTHKRAHTMARGSGKCRNTIQDYTQGHARALQSLNSVYLTSGQPICQSLPLHLSLSSSHMQMHFFFHLIHSHWGIIIFGTLQTLSSDGAVIQAATSTASMSILIKRLQPPTLSVGSVIA